MNKLKVAFAVLLLSASYSFAQNTTSVVVRDLESWSSLGISKKIGDRFKLGLQQEFRFYDNSSQMDQYFTNLSANYSLMKFMSIETGFRYIRDKDADDGLYENHFRYNVDLNFKHKFDRLALKYRFRWQMRDELGTSRQEGDFMRYKQRLKLGLAYNVPNWKFDPEISTELFRSSGKYMLSSFDKIRFTLGTDYNVKKIGELGIFYRIERELGVSYPQTTHILGAGFTFKL